MWRQLDNFLFVRLVLPWLPLLILFQVDKVKTTAPEILGAATVVLAARLIADGSFKGLLAGAFAFLPLIESVLLMTGATRSFWLAWTSYALAAVGTVLVVVSEVRQRR